MKLSEKLARLKARRGLTTDALSLKSGIPKGTINKVLNGETRNPTISTLKAWAEALECPLEWLNDSAGSAAVPPPQPGIYLACAAWATERRPIGSTICCPC